MIDGRFALAFATGMVATVNPCGFAMLPAYLSYFVGIDNDDGDTERNVLRAIGVGAAVTTGFVVVFGVVGAVVEVLSVRIEPGLPWLEMLVGVGLASLGVAMLRGYEPSLRVPRLERGGTSREFGSMFLFGISYAVASIGCALPLFLNLTFGSVAVSGPAGRIGQFVAYAAGMGVVLVALTVALALARHGVVRRLRSLLPYVHRVSGALLVPAGLYVAYYGWISRQVLDDGAAEGTGVYEWANGINDDVRQWVVDTGAVRLGTGLAAAVAVVVLAAYALRARAALPSAPAPTTRAGSD